MYDYYSSEYSDYSDYSENDEYNTVQPYDFELASKVEETPLEKLQRFIEGNDFEQFESILPTLIETIEKKDAVCNGDLNNSKSISESGDTISEEESDDDFLDNDENAIPVQSKTHLKEIILKNGETPLMLASAEGNDRMIEHLLSMGFNVNYQIPNSGKTALLNLCSATIGGGYSKLRNESTNNWNQRMMKCLRSLINAGADLKVKSFMKTEDYGNTCVHYVAENNHFRLLDVLIHAGADIDTMNNQKKTPLMISASKGHVACCNLLLLAGANASLVERTSRTAADLAEIEGYGHLSDAINVYSGAAQHNIRLYQTWSHFVPQSGARDACVMGNVDITSYNHSCIESFCLALEAPYLMKIMEEQGISIGDLKMMDDNRLCELGIPKKDSQKIVSAMKDMNRLNVSNTNNTTSTSRLNLEYGRPLRPMVILEMLGNIGEHIEFIDANLESLLYHLSKNEEYYQGRYRIVNKSTLSTIKDYSKMCIDESRKLHSEFCNLRKLAENYSSASNIIPNGDVLSKSNAFSSSNKFGYLNRRYIVLGSIMASSAVIALFVLTKLR